MFAHAFLRLLGRGIIAVLAGASGCLAQPGMLPPAGIGAQLEALWRGRAHFQEMRDIDWGAPPYSTFSEGAGWFAKPMPLPGGEWYLFSRQAIAPKPPYCPADAARVVARRSGDRGRTWSTPATVVASPGGPGSPDACAILDGATFFDAQTGTWQMLAQCLAADDKGGWGLCHYSRRGSSPMGPFAADQTLSVRGGQLWSQICADSRACDPAKTHDEGTPDIVEKRNGYFYVTFHGYDPPYGVRGVAKTRDFHHWIVAAPDLPDAPLFTAASCRAWNRECIGAGEASALDSGAWRYVLVETPSLNLACITGQRWPIALLRAPAGIYPPAGSSLWRPYPHNPLLVTAWPGPASKCGIQYPRWAVADGHVYILYEDFGYQKGVQSPSVFRRRLLELVPGPGAPVQLAHGAQ